MNGLTGTRRLARPVRLSLARDLGGDIDGAWWPHSAAVARELPEFIQLMHRPLGEVLDICVNWSNSEAAMDLSTIASGAGLVRGAQHRRPRLMAVTGRDGCLRLLVVPHLTPQALGTMVMRCAAAMPAPEPGREAQLLETANTVIRLAEAESARWTTHMNGENATDPVAAQPVHD
ncbi:DUF5994 family protein [Mycobacterium deserti]|uniref:DUF5994 family protein n=1 Tax=Mycobacterium deserti TaxID=2978347 RepID=A0ABT2M7Z4_9MYCO|nr:DUF5994 family protein [Mycobacterium deserti]MCT7658383.1 DUF5994 family protein [Mycobacterium deserti]